MSRIGLPGPHGRRRRRSSIMIALSLAATMLAGACGGGFEPEDLESSIRSGPVDDLGLVQGKPHEGTHIRLLICCNTTAQFMALRERTRTEFTPRTGITVEWANIPYDSYLQKIVAESAIGGGTYDLVAWPDAYGASAKIGLQRLDGALNKAGRSITDYPPPFQQAAAAGEEGSVYGLPFRGFSYNLFYRKDRYAELGLQPPETWDEYSAQLAELKRTGARHPMAGQYGRGSGQNLYTWLSMLWSNGADVFDAKGAPAFTSPEAVEATEKYISLIRDGYSPPESANWNETDATQSFEQNAADTVLTWSWQIDDFTDPEKTSPEVANNLGVASLPGWAGKPTITYGYTWLMGILNTSKKQGPAWEYLKWLSHPSVERAIALDKSDPAAATSVVVHTENMLDEQVNDANFGMPRLQESSLRNGRTIPMTIDWPQIQDELEVAINKMAHGAEVRATLNEAAANIRALER